MAKTKTSKRMSENKAKVEKTKLYTLEEAIALVKETSTVKFDASVEIHARLGIDPKKGDQQVRSTVVLPHGNGKTKSIAAFVDANNEKAARDAGADFVYGEDDIKEIKQTGKIDFDIAVAVPTMMPKLAVAAQVLGPKGLMPNPKSGTVGTDVAKMVKELKGGKVAFKNDDTSNVHLLVGKVSFDNQKLLENIQTFLEVLKKSKPSTSKGVFIKSVYLTSAMGPSVKVDVS